MADPLPDTPWGDDSYTEEFLRQARDALQHRLRLLATFVLHHGPQTEALHVALHILRVNLSGRLVHLYRFCPWSLLRPWTATLADDLHDWMRIIVGLPIAGAHPFLALHAPIAQGGLGIPHPQQEAALHHLQAVWPLFEELSATEHERSSAYLGALDALQFLDRLADVDLRKASAATSPMHRGAKIREVFYERMGLQLRVACPWLQSPGLPKTPDPEITWRWQMTVQMSWYTASPRTFLLAGPLRLALAQHLGLPIYLPGQRCRYVPLTTGRMCGKQLGMHSAHACTCAQGPGLRRHNRLRDTWISLCRQAGWHTDPEQDIHTREAETKRADLVSLTPDGTRMAADVMVTATPTPWESHGDHLLRSENAKASRYHASAWTATPEGTTIVPLIHDALNHWLAPSALRFLHRLAIATAHRSAPRRPDGLGCPLPPDLCEHGHLLASHQLRRRMAASCRLW